MIKTPLATHVPFIPLIFTHREGNKAAHYVASLSFNFLDMYWFHEVPHGMYAIIAKDVNESFSLFE